MDLTWSSMDLDKGLEVDISEASWHMLWYKTELGRQGNIIIIKVYIECKWLHFIATNIFLWIKQNLIINIYMAILLLLSHAAWACFYQVKNVKFYKIGFLHHLSLSSECLDWLGVALLAASGLWLDHSSHARRERDCSRSNHLFSLICEFHKITSKTLLVTAGFRGRRKKSVDRLTNI